MRTRKLGNSGLELTTVGLGTWAIGGAGWRASWGRQDDTESIAAIHRAIELGVNWIDTAAVYGLGHSEEMVGEAIRGHRHEVLIATKCGQAWGEDRQIIRTLKAESLRREVEGSLRRLGIDTIDLYQIHWPIPDEELEEAWYTMAEFVKEGKARCIGVSNFSVEQMKRVLPIHPIASLQPPYSMLRREVEPEILPFCGQNGIGVIAYSPMQAGLLTGKFNKEYLTTLDAEDWRLKNPLFQEPLFSLNVEMVEAMKPIAERSGRSMAELAIAWVMRRPEMTAAIVGARRPSQIEGTAPASDWVLSPEDAAAIDTLLQARDAKLANLP